MAKRPIPNRALRNKPVGLRARETPGWKGIPRILPQPGGGGRRGSLGGRRGR